MNTTFDIHRFVSYLKLRQKASLQHYLIAAGIIGGLYLVTLILIYGGNWIFVNTFFNLIPAVAILIVIVSPCIMEKNLNKNTSVISFMLPVSNTERFLSLFLKYIVILPLISLFLLYIVDFITVYFKIDENIPHYTHKYLSKGLLNNELLYLIFGAQALSLLGYLYFRKYAIFKIALIAIIIMFFVPILSFSSAKIITGIEFNKDFATLLFPSDYVNRYSPPVHWVVNISDSILKIISPFLLWIIAFFKLKEIEI